MRSRVGSAARFASSVLGDRSASSRQESQPSYVVVRSRVGFAARFDCPVAITLRELDLSQLHLGCSDIILMSQPYGNRVIGVGYKQLPHLVAEYGRYSVTIRSANSLPRDVLERLEWIHLALKEVNAQSSEAYLLQRKLFLTIEKYADSGHGFSPFKEGHVADCMQHFLKTYERDGLRFSAWVIMPNHLHLLTEPVAFASVEAFMKTWQQFKGMTGHKFNRLLNRSGPFWQTEWYDRLIRDEVEYQKWVTYLKANPLKAGLCACENEYPYRFGLD